MKRKMIFFDIDGTIVIDNTHTIPEKTVQAIRKARENGHLVFINTGRTFFNVTEDIKSIGFDGYVCGCGTYIHCDDMPLLAESIPKETCIEIVKKLREYKIDGIFEGSSGFFFDQTETLSDEMARKRDRFGLQGFDMLKAWDNPNITFDKFLIWTNEESNLEAFHTYITKDFNYIDRGHKFGEIVPKGFSKATGIKFLQDYFHIPLENCYAIGDSTNDLPMLEYVPHSIAMGNSTPLLFDLVSFVTKDIKEDGIEYALSHFGII